MLNNTQAETQLKTFTNPTIETDRLSRISAMKEPLRTLGYLLFRLNKDGKPFKDYTESNEAMEKLSAKLFALSDDQREKLFTAIFPNLSPWVSEAWNLIGTTPYQIGYYRRCFRDPNNLELTKVKKSNWLLQLISELQLYNPDLEWVACWAAYLHHGTGATAVSYLFAPALNQGYLVENQGKNRSKKDQEVIEFGNKIFQILKDSASNLHEIGAMGRHIPQSFLTCNRPDAWEFMEKFLFAAQRQEGLRQVILETIDESHPQAFARMVKFILDNNLTRFSATIRAMAVWFNYNWDDVKPRQANEVLERLHQFFSDPMAIEKVCKTGEPESIYLALWSLGVQDVSLVIPFATKLLQDSRLGVRYVTVRLLKNLSNPIALDLLLQSLKDTDLRIAFLAFQALSLLQLNKNKKDYSFNGITVKQPLPDLFESFEEFLNRLPQKAQQTKALVWDWEQIVLDRKLVASALLNSLGNRSPKVLLPYFSYLQSYQKWNLMEKLVEKKPWDSEIRDLLFRFIGERDGYLRENAIKAMKNVTLLASEVEQLEVWLTKSGSDLRRSVLTMILNQNKSFIDDCSERLLQSKNKNQRCAGLSILCDLAMKNDYPATRRERGKTFIEQMGNKLSSEELTLLDTLERTGHKKITLEDALGLVDVSLLKKIEVPKDFGTEFVTPAAIDLLKSLDGLVEKYRDTLVEGTDYNNVKWEGLLGNNTFPGWDEKLTPEENLQRMPLREVWQDWLQNRSGKLKDKDGMELDRARLVLKLINYDWYLQEWKKSLKSDPILSKHFASLLEMVCDLKIRYMVTKNILRWLTEGPPSAQFLDWCLDSISTILAKLNENQQDKIEEYLKNKSNKKKGNDGPTQPHDLRGEYVGLYSQLYNFFDSEFSPSKLSDSQFQRYWNLLRFYEQPAPELPRKIPLIGTILEAHQRGLVNENDFTWFLIGSPHPGKEELQSNYYYRSFPISYLTHPTLDKFYLPYFEKSPELQQWVDRCRDQILDIELSRGDLPIASSQLISSINSVHGLPRLLQFLEKLGTKKLPKQTGYHNYSLGTNDIFTDLISKTIPRTEDTKEAFCQIIKPFIQKKIITSERLLELAFLNPRWAEHIWAYFQWPGFLEAIDWFLIHTHSSKIRAANEQEWEKQIAQQTAISQEERAMGVIDPEWFYRVYSLIGAKRWKLILPAVKQCCSLNNAKKAFLLADVLLGKTSKSALIQDVRKKFLKNSVRLLGLFPTYPPEKSEKREMDLQKRFDILQQYHRYAKSLSPLSREDAIRTAQIGLENLARTAGYSDALRMEWAMGSKAVADLASGPVQKTVDGVQVTLSLDETGQPITFIHNNGKEVKSLPPRVKKDKKLKELLDRKQDLKRQTSRIKGALEQAMVRQEVFTASELAVIFNNPLLRPYLEKLIFMTIDSDNSKNAPSKLIGYLDQEGKALRSHQGKKKAIRQNDRLRIAHSVDLFASGEWHLWQSECFRSERVQPFKQVFRELYTLTVQEKKPVFKSERYSGQQVNPQQANALWASKNWKTHEGIEKTFYHEKIRVEVHFKYGFATPLEVEGYTIDSVLFYSLKDWKPLDLEKIPSILFSEVMRDMDLVVSVAHRGGVDPEASQSTIEMRTALLKETCTFLKLDNVRYQGTHALIDGNIANYSIHLGSGVVHRQPGGAVCIIPIPAQHRGRIFLPFADDDPRTAEVISKVLLLAKDSEIQDPTILEQIRRH